MPLNPRHPAAHYNLRLLFNSPFCDSMRCALEFTSHPPFTGGFNVISNKLLLGADKPQFVGNAFCFLDLKNLIEIEELDADKQAQIAG